MSRRSSTKKRARSVFDQALILTLGLGAGSAIADSYTPPTLRMRPHEARPTPRRLAQAPDAPPDAPNEPPTDADPPPTDPPPATAPTAAPATAPIAPDVPPAGATDEPPSLTDEELAALAEAEAAAGAEVIEITGSTLDRRELTTAAPVTVLDRADLEGAGVATIGDILQNLPAQSNAINAQVNNGGDGSTRVDIRGLGTNRTLVLLNGRRVVPGGTGADASVDLNAIPLAVIERVEVLKDGASAVYGSDAIGGVVNIITREDFNGTETTLYTGNSQRNDGFTYDMSFVTGHSSKKGNLIFSAGWQRQRPVFAGDRAFSRFDRDYDFAEPDPSKREYIGGSLSTPDGFIAPGSIDYDGDGMPDGREDLCGVDVPACRPDGRGGWLPFRDPEDLYNYQPSNYLFTPSQRYNAFAKGHYDLTSNTKVFFEGLYLNRQSDQRLAPEPFAAAVPISADSIYNPTGGTVFEYRRRLEEFGPRRTLQNIDTFRVVAGVSGKLPSDVPLLQGWRWEVSYNYGHTTGLQQSRGNLILSRLANALGPSFVDANGVPRCGTPGNVIDGCVPMNIMGASGSISRDQASYVTFTGVSTGYNDQKTALAQMGGQLVKLPNGGDISLAIGGDYRSEAGGFTPDPLTSTGDTTGNAQAPTAGSYNALEAFSELSIVPISGKKFVEWAELNLAARAYRYDSFGSGVTGKAGALFKTVNGLALRGTYSSAFRAPSVGELYQGMADDFPSAKDPCDTSDGPITNPTTAARCAEQGVPTDATLLTRQQRARVGGNANLAAESASVFTGGIVFEPPQVKGLSVTVDYFNVRIRKAIQALGAQVILANCYTRDLSEACAAIHRDPVLHSIDYIDDLYSNVGGTSTDGIDFATAYNWSIGENKLRHQFEGQYLHAYEVDNGTGTPLQGVGFYDLGVYPKLKANLTTTWARGPLQAGLNVRFVGGFKECVDNDCNTQENLDTLSRDVDANVTADVFVGYEAKTAAGTSRVTIGVNNLTDQDPPLIYTGFAGDSDASTYDYMGRYFYARLTQLF